jgi:glycosyltransferase involved in cell wall biosynthesis
MTRSVIIGTLYNPFIIRYWLENFKRWQHKVDAVYLCHDRKHVPEIKKFLDKEVAKYSKIHILDDLGGWPYNMEQAIKQTKEDLILVVHDDTYFYNPEILDVYFDEAEKGKVITPLFVSYAPIQAVDDAVKNKYPFMPWRVGEYTSCSFLLYLLFCSRENYLKTDVDFSNNLWEKGEYIKELDYTPEERFGGDTGFRFGFQLLNSGVEVKPIKANNLSNIAHETDPIKTFNEMVKNGLDWLHLQNVSNMIPLWFDSEEDWYAGTVDRTKHKIWEMEVYKDNKDVLEGIAMKK